LRGAFSFSLRKNKPLFAVPAGLQKNREHILGVSIFYPNAVKELKIAQMMTLEYTHATR
jgi:hypothetical protein